MAGRQPDYCGNCGAKVEPQNIYCIRCGQKLEDFAPPTHSRLRPPIVWVAALIVICAVAGIALGVWLVQLKPTGQIRDLAFLHRPTASPPAAVGLSPTPARTAPAVVVTITPTALPSAVTTPTPLATPSPETLSPGDTWIRSADGAVMVYVPAGEFEMGSTETDESTPVHTVYLDAYWIDRTEVTNRQFRMFVEATGYQTTAEREGTGRVWTGDDWEYVSGANWRAPYGPGTSTSDDSPVVQVSWHDATEFCRWVGGRLPSEAEWEKAARGTDGRHYPWGNGIAGNRLNACDQNCPASWRGDFDDGYGFSAPVGAFPSGASPYGALDLAGNVWEWVFDWYGEGYYSDSPHRNPTGPSSGTQRVMRGGSWGSNAIHARTFNRFWGSPDRRDDDVGFRCVVDVP